ncbi:MAG: NAD-dependent epimerase/dehydratase family protein [Planctomycetota bacterium]
MKIFLTGSTGLLGNNVLRLAVQRGDQVQALVRQPVVSEIFDDLLDAGAVETVLGDLVSEAVLDQVIGRSDAVIHSAGMIHLGWKQLEESMAVNRDGTRYIVEACIKHDKPLVWIGTVNTLAVGSRREVANEQTPLDFQGGQVPCSYVLSKRAALEEIRMGVRRGLRAITIHPGFMLGPFDWKPSSGRMVVELDKAYRPLAPSGGGSICDVRDVAEAALSALSRLIDGQLESGREYITAGENWTYLELWKAISKQVNRSRPIMAAGPLQRWIGARVGDLISRLGDKESDLNSAAVAMSSQFHWYDSTRAVDELDYRIRDPYESLADCVDFLRKRGMIRPQKTSKIADTEIKADPTAD